LLLVITVLASLQFAAQRTLELNRLLSTASEQRLALDAIVKAAGQHVQAMTKGNTSWG
jgi:hypothetical protein